MYELHHEKTCFLHMQKVLEYVSVFVWGKCVLDASDSVRLKLIRDDTETCLINKNIIRAASQENLSGNQARHKPCVQPKKELEA